MRFACLFSGNGYHSKEWWAKGEGANMELGKVLESLRPFREKMLFLRGLYNQEALIGGIHSCQTGNLLTGATSLAGWRHPVWRELRSNPGGPAQGANQGAQPGAGLRAVDRGDPQKLLDDL